MPSAYPSTSIVVLGNVDVANPPGVSRPESDEALPVIFVSSVSISHLESREAQALRLLLLFFFFATPRGALTRG